MLLSPSLFLEKPGKDETGHGVRAANAVLEANHATAGLEPQVYLALSLLLLHTVAAFWAIAVLEGGRKGRRKRTDMFCQGLE